MLKHFFVLSLLFSYFGFGLAGNQFQVGNEVGKAVSAFVESKIEIAGNIIFRWQDEVSFNADETVRDIIRFGRKFEGNLKRLEVITNKTLEDVLPTDSIASRKNDQKFSSLMKMAPILLTSLKSSSKSMCDVVNKTRTDLINYYYEVSGAYSELDRSKQLLSNLRNSTLEEIVSIHLNLTKLDRELKKIFRSMNAKTDELIALRASILGLTIADIGVTFAPPPFSFFASIALSAAQMALEHAADKLTEELRVMTEKYLRDVEQLGYETAKFNEIDLSLERIVDLNNRCQRVRTYLISTEDNKQHNLKQWEKMSISLALMESLIPVSLKVIENGYIEYVTIDYNLIKDAWLAAKKSARITL